MKWGKRQIGGIKEGMSVRAQTQKDMIIHPIHSAKAQINMTVKHPLKAIGGGTQALKDLNTDVANRVQKTKKKKSMKENHATGSKAVGKTLSFIGKNIARAHTLSDANKVSKMVFPD